MVGKASPGPAESVRLTRAGHRLGKPCRMAVRDVEVAADAARAVAKHPLSISPSRSRFALYSLCKVVTGSAVKGCLAVGPSAHVGIL